MAPKQLKLTELFSIRDVAVKKVKRKLSGNKSVASSLGPPEKRGILTAVDDNCSVNEEIGGSDDCGESLSIGSAATNALLLDPVVSVLTEPKWCTLLEKEFNKEYMKGIWRFLEEQDKKGSTVFPPRHLVFNAFNLTPFDQIRVVILGQDPYHNLGQAHGLCFSVPNGEPMPPSLKNIFKELSSEYSNFQMPKHGTLTKWATQGVFLLNATLTVEAHKANSHSHIGWQRFTDAVIKLISDRSELGSVFLLWGGFAQKKEALIDKKRHRVIKTAHPSPLSAHRFFGCKCFSQTNMALMDLGREPIDWTAL